MENENLCLNDEIRRKDKVIKVLLENFSNRVPEHSNYITSKNTEISIQTDQQTKNNIQSSTTSSTIIAKWHHSTILATAKENDKNQKKLNIFQLNSKTYGKIHANKNSN